MKLETRPNWARKVRDMNMSTMAMSTMSMTTISMSGREKDGTEEVGIFVAGGRTRESKVL